MIVKVKKDKEERTKTGTVLILSLLFLSYFLPLFNIKWLSQFFPYIYAVFCCFYLIKYTLCEYTYTFNETNLKIEKVSVYKTYEFLVADYDDIILVTSKKGFAKDLTAGFLDKNFYILSYRVKGKIKKVRIQKNEAITNNFKMYLGDRFYD